MTMLEPDDLRQRLLARVVDYDTNGGCWLWNGALSGAGYGRIFYKGKNRHAHRLSWEAFRGDLGTKWALHRCDIRACINPDHLFLGDHAANMADMAEKGRVADMRGLKNPNVKLTAEQVAFVRSSPLSAAKLAVGIGCSPTTVWAARSPKSGKWAVV